MGPHMRLARRKRKKKKKMACDLIQMYTIKDQLAFDLDFIIFVSSTRVS